jgi:osmotically-inducible protein OsmY
MSDNRFITDEIRATLERDERVPHPSEVAVSERHGTVTLRGSVGSPHQRRAAVKIARSVSGVVAIEDELWVDPRDRWPDNEIRGAGLQALMSSAKVPAERIEVVVEKGWLTLKGEVKHQSESNAAFEAVRGLPGVGGITNEIKVITAGVDG